MPAWRLAALLVLAAGGRAFPALPEAGGLRSADLFRLHSVSDVQLSPDGTRVAYTVRISAGSGRPKGEAWIMDVASQRGSRLGDDRRAAWGVRFSPRGNRIAYFVAADKGVSIAVARPDGSRARVLASVVGTNHPLPSTGESLAWSPEGGRIAFVSATPGPEPDANGDPRIVTRYLYKPSTSRPDLPFNDNRRLHLFVVDVASGQVRPLTSGPFHDHSPSWSPSGEEIAFVSNREADPDRVFNNDIFAVRVRDGAVRRLTDTRSAEYAPTWSPDGRSIAFLATRRPLTSSETTMEDDHVFVMEASGTHTHTQDERREVGQGIDNRQGAPRWSADGRSLLFTVQERGDVGLYRLPLPAGAPERVLPADGPGVVSSWSVAASGRVAAALATPVAPPELYVRDASGPRRLTSLDDALLRARGVAPVEPLPFESHDGTALEAFLTLPWGRTPTSRHPLVVLIHGGPHAQQGRAFNPRAQVYAGRGWATLMVNYRGSTGYGQKLADAIFGDQDGAEARDVLAGVDAALRRHPWLDPGRLGIEGGSYGGQLTNWIVTQTGRFQAAIATAGISNLVSFNYTAYYHDYLAVEYGAYPHENGLIDRLWERSPLRLVAKVKTPVLLLHGENDNDVPIAEAEQFYIALKDVGVETMMIRYPREGHGLAETAHVVDALDRSIDWYERHFRPQDD